MIGLYGALFLSKNGKDAEAVWLEVLKDLPPKALDTGIERLMTLEAGGKFSEYPPNPMQFRALCNGDFSKRKLPSASEALREISNFRSSLKHIWSHHLVAYLAHKLPGGFFELDDIEQYQTFNSLYGKASLLIGQGYCLPECESKVLISHKPSPNLAENHLKKLYRHLGSTQ